MIKALLVDDEQHARTLFKELVRMAQLPVNIVGECDNLPAAIQFINRSEIDVVFMDIDMPNYSGLQISDFFENYNFKLVYVTAHGNHVVEALRKKAFDYLIKPIDVDDLRQCVERIQKELDQEIQLTSSLSKDEQQIAIHTLQGVDFIAINEILYLEASAMYTTIRSTSGQEFVVSKPLKEFEFLQEHGFYRTHRSFIVNIRKIKRFLVIEGNEVEVENGVKIPVSRTRKEAFLSFLNSEIKIVHK